MKPPANRAPLLGVDEALDRVLRFTPPGGTETVPVVEAIGRALAEAVRADRDHPPFNRAMMDGYGVRVEDAGRGVRVVAEVPAGRPWDGRITRGHAVEIMTGAPCPEGVETVVPVEQVEVRDGSVHLPGNLRHGGNIAPRGTDCAASRTLAEAGTIVTPLLASVLAAVGKSCPLVWKRPSAAIIVTGDELGASDTAAKPHLIRDSNGPLLRSILSASGAGAVGVERAADDEAALRAALRVTDGADIVILTGGVSAGRWDLVPACVAAEGWRIEFHGVAQKPGKPLLFAERGGRLLFGLPGNPLAVLVCTHRYVCSALRRMVGRQPPEAPRARLVEPISTRGERVWFCPARVMNNRGSLTLLPLQPQSSADIFTVCHANALLRLDPGAEYEADEMVLFEWLAGAAPW